MEKKQQLPEQIEIRGAKVHNLKNVDVNIPLHKIVGVAGVSGSGKSSLALGVLYVLDEPSIGLHPSNLEGLTGVMDDLRLILSLGTEIKG